MTDDKDRRIQDLEKAIKVQANAFRAFMAQEDRELIRLRKLEVEAYLAVNQLDSEREMNAILTDEVEELRRHLGAEVTDERAKIVAYLRDCNDYYSHNWANDIEEGKHL